MISTHFSPFLFDDVNNFCARIIHINSFCTLHLHWRSRWPGYLWLVAMRWCQRTRLCDGECWWGCWYDVSNIQNTVRSGREFVTKLTIMPCYYNRFRMFFLLVLNGDVHAFVDGRSELVATEFARSLLTDTAASRVIAQFWFCSWK